MLNTIIRLESPYVFVPYIKPLEQKEVLIKPRYMSVCRADIRYFLGKRDIKTLKEKLPCALIHEAEGVVISDTTGTFSQGDIVAMVPNIPNDNYKDLASGNAGALEKNIAKQYENYGSLGFMSSGKDGFLQEFISLDANRVVKLPGNLEETGALAEFISVAVHAARRAGLLEKSAYDLEQQYNGGANNAYAQKKQTDAEIFCSESAKNAAPLNIAIIGDGPLGFITHIALRFIAPNANIAVFGHSINKLNLFNMADSTYLSDGHNIKNTFDAVFECTGGEGLKSAYSLAVDIIKPQGKIMLLGVGENAVPLLTRMVLEKGITLIGCSRSAGIDFEYAAKILSNKNIISTLQNIIDYCGEIKTIQKLVQIFQYAASNKLKTIFKLNI